MFQAYFKLKISIPSIIKICLIVVPGIKWSKMQLNVWTASLIRCFEKSRHVFPTQNSLRLASASGERGAATPRPAQPERGSEADRASAASAARAASPRRHALRHQRSSQPRAGGRARGHPGGRLRRTPGQRTGSLVGRQGGRHPAQHRHE